MSLRPSICMPATAMVLLLAGCLTPVPLHPTPLTQNEVDQFLAGGRDARVYGITTYQDAAGARFEFANRPQSYRSAQLHFIPAEGSPRPMVLAETQLSGKFPLLLDSSARHSWAVMQSIRGLEFRPFKPPTGEYADHVATAIPGYAGVGHQLILDGLHVQNPVFYMPPARGGLGALARIGENPQALPAARAALEKIAGRMPAVAGAALLRAFAYIRLDFPHRSVRFSTEGPYQPADATSVLATLPLREWQGRPAVQAELDGEPLTLVIDTAGDFDVALPRETTGSPGTLTLGALQIEVQPVTHASLGLPEQFPARLGLGVLARYAVTLDFQQQRVWFENPALPEDRKSVSSTVEQPAAPVHYRGIRP